MLMTGWSVIKIDLPNIKMRFCDILETCLDLSKGNCDIQVICSRKSRKQEILHARLSDAVKEYMSVNYKKLGLTPHDLTAEIAFICNRVLISK